MANLTIGNKINLPGTKRVDTAADVPRAAGQPAPAANRPRDEDGFDGPTSKHVNLTGVGIVDRAQDALDKWSLAVGLVSAGATFTPAAPAGIAGSATTDLVDLSSALVDATQALAAALRLDGPEAMKQLRDAIMRGASAVPGAGLAVQSGKQVARIANESVSSVDNMINSTVEHPAFRELKYTAGIKNASLSHVVTNREAATKVTELANQIMRGDTAGSTLARFGGGPAGMNKFLHEICETFAERGAKALDVADINKMSESIDDLVGPNHILGGAATMAIGRLATKDLDLVRESAKLVSDTSNPLIKSALGKAFNDALQSNQPAQELVNALEKAKQLSSGGARVLSDVAARTRQHGTDAPGVFTSTMNRLLEPDISPANLRQALQAADGKDASAVIAQAIGLSRGFR